VKAQIANISLSYCVDVKNAEDGGDFIRKGREAKRTLRKMLAKKLWEDGLVDFETKPEFDQKIVIVKAEISVLKKGEE
jgi:hypothetical protein